MRFFTISSMPVFLATIFVLAGSKGVAQDTTAISSENPHHLVYEKGGGGLNVKQNGKYLTQNELFDVLNEDIEAADYVGKFKTKNTIGAVLGGFGGAFIGFPVGQAIAGGEPQWIMALSGLGVLAIAIPITISANKDIKTGIDVYNENLVAGAFVPRPILQFGGQQHGVGLSLKF